MTIDFQSIRNESARRCAEAGFVFAPSLPLSENSELRPRQEIADRLAAICQLFIYVSAPEDRMPEARIREYLDRHGMHEMLTEQERDIVSTPRADAHDAHNDSVGWKMENAWPLAWILGFPAEPSVDGQMIDQHIRPLVREFVPLEPDRWPAAVAGYTSRPIETVVQLEDLFYCVHNAVRCAQYSPPPSSRLAKRPPRFVPSGFDPVIHGGVIHERRHALTWALSPGVEWNDTDLST